MLVLECYKIRRREEEEEAIQLGGEPSAVWCGATLVVL